MARSISLKTSRIGGIVPPGHAPMAEVVSQLLCSGGSGRPPMVLALVVMWSRCSLVRPEGLRL
jgi:hypothetical protein